MKAKKPPVMRKGCGTYAGRSSHEYYNEQSCASCIHAYNVYQRGVERAKRRANGIRPSLTRVTISIETFELMYWQLDKDIQDRLDEELGRKKIDRIIDTVDELKELDKSAAE